MYIKKKLVFQDIETPRDKPWTKRLGVFVHFCGGLYKKKDVIYSINVSLLS